MKTLTRMHLALMALITLSVSAFAQSWQLVWSDEFNGSIGPDWVFETGTGNGGWGNNELQYYRQQNATIENNALVITAKRENFGGMGYTSARLKTQGKKSWKYGRIEARIRMPSFMGSWPAFWMLGDDITQVGWPRCGEIDVMEHINNESVVYGTAHWFDHTNNHAHYTGNIGTNVTDWHVYAVEWDSSHIRWFRDGVQYHEITIAGSPNGTSELHNPFFLILNFAIGGDWPGFNIDNSAFPAKMHVDWVRVYQRGSAPPVPSSQPLFMLVNRNSGKPVDLVGGNQSNGAPIKQWNYDYNSANQRWALVPTADGNHFTIVSTVSGKVLCVEGNSGASGAKIHSWTYNGFGGQQWDLVHAGNGWYKLRNVGSGLVLDVKDASTASDATLQQWTDNGTNAQLWRLHPWGDYNIKASTGKYICVQGASGNNGNNIIQYTHENQPWFKWHFYSNSEGWSRVSSLAALSRAISIKNGSTSSGADGHLWDHNSSFDDQKIRIRPLTNGRYKFYFKHSGMAWDIPGGNTGNNVPLRQYPDNGNAWQQFTLERVQ